MINAIHLDNQIELAKEHNLGGALRLAVLHRIKKAAQMHEQYTDEQFKYWMSCLDAAAGMVDDKTVEAGIYRDLGWLYDSYGSNDRAVMYYRKSIEADQKSAFCCEMEKRIKELT